MSNRSREERTRKDDGQSSWCKELQVRVVGLEDQVKRYKPLIKDFIQLPRMVASVEALQSELERLKEAKEKNEVRFERFSVAIENIDKILCDQKEVSKQLNKLESQSTLCKNGIEEMKKSLEDFKTTIDGFKNKGFDTLLKILFWVTASVLPWVLFVFTYMRTSGGKIVP